MSRDFACPEACLSRGLFCPTEEVCVPQGGFGDRSRGGRGGGRRGGGSRGGYGSVVYAGKVLLGLTPGSELIVYEPNGDEFKELAKYKVSKKRLTPIRFPSAIEFMSKTTIP